VARLAVAAFYVGLAVTLGADKGGDFVSEMSREVYDRRYGGRR
jgi:hypothetical protein